MTNHSALTRSYDTLSRKLISEATIIASDGKLFHTEFAQWDTGATGTCISHKVAEQLHLIPSGMSNVKTPSGSKTVNTHVVSINLLNGVTVNDVITMETEIGDQEIDVLIGMDIINLGDFAVSNFMGKTTFSFRIPSQAKADYVAIIQGLNPKKSEKRIMPNDPCPCGSGKKYKRCCGRSV